MILQFITNNEKTTNKMKKLLSILVCVILIFNSCIKDDVIYLPLVMVDIGVIGYCVDNSGVIYKTINSGQSWSETGSDHNMNEERQVFTLAWDFDSYDTIYANYLYDFVSLSTVYKYPNYPLYLTSNNYVSSSVNSGTEWDFTSNLNTEITIFDFVNKNIGFVVNKNIGNIRRSEASSNGFLYWRDQGGLPAHSLFVDFVSPTTGYCVDSLNNVYMTQDFNANNSAVHWTNTGSIPEDVMFVCFNNETTGYCVTNSGNIHKTTNSGMSWSVTGSMPEDVNFIDFDNETTGYFVTNSGKIHKTTNSGMSWKIQGSMPENVIFIDFNS
jgi:hypothetical protein